MIRVRIAILLMLCVCISISASDFDSKMQKAIKLMDNGALEESLIVLDSLDNEYPNNYFIKYEIGFAYYLAKDYKKAINIYEKLISHPDATAQAYQMLGNLYDDIANPKKALKTYSKGLKKYPNSGSLYLEIGITNWKLNNLEKAINAYENGINVDANFPSNYYRAAEYMLHYGDPVWAILYAETMVILAPNDKRTSRVSEIIDDAMNKLVKIMVEKDSLGHNQISLSIFSKSDDALTESAFSMLYQLGLVSVFTDSASIKIEDGLSLKNMAKMREQAVTACAGGEIRQLSIISYLKKIIDSGHWMAYNMWLLRFCRMDEAQKWFEENPGALDAFAEWFNVNPYDPTINPTLSKVSK